MGLICRNVILAKSLNMQEYSPTLPACASTIPTSTANGGLSQPYRGRPLCWIGYPAHGCSTLILLCILYHVAGMSRRPAQPVACLCAQGPTPRPGSIGRRHRPIGRIRLARSALRRSTEFTGRGLSFGRTGWRFPSRSCVAERTATSALCRLNCEPNQRLNDCGRRFGPNLGPNRPDHACGHPRPATRCSTRFCGSRGVSYDLPSHAGPRPGQSGRRTRPMRSLDTPDSPERSI